MRIHFFALAIVACTLFCISLAEDSTCNSITVKETVLDSRVTDFHWSVITNDTRVVFAHTLTYGLYRSHNHGATWVNMLPNMTGSQTPVAPYYRSGVRNMYIHPRHERHIYFLGWGGLLWYSSDRGITFQNRTFNFVIEELYLHPVRYDWLLAFSYSDPCYYSAQAGDCYSRLMLSQDFGVTWRVLDTYVYQATWGRAGNAGLHGVTNGTIWLLEWADKTGRQAYKPVRDLDLIHTADLLVSRMPVPDDLNDNVTFMLHHNNNTYLAKFAAKGGYEMWVSEDDGITFNQAKFPVTEHPTENQYTILDDSEGSVFINVLHGSNYWGNLYMSNALGSEYQLSMAHNRRDSYGRSSFMRARGIEGIYVANQVQGVGPNYPGGHGSRTKFTYDKGEQWNLLGIPTHGAGHAKVPCDTNATGVCGLSIHTTNKRTDGVNPDIYGPLYSHENAIGLVIGTGAVGDYLIFDTDSVATFFSRNAGWTWDRISLGNNVYEFADHGSILLLIPQYQATQRFRYSLTQGLNFTDCTLTTSDMYVSEIFSDPGKISRNFIVHGYRYVNGMPVGVVVHVGFENAGIRTCGTEDYEDYIPRDEASEDRIDSCIMGQRVVHQRRQLYTLRTLVDQYPCSPSSFRRRGSACLNTKEYEPIRNHHACECKRQDFECDTCFTLNRETMECHQIQGCTSNTDPPVPCIGSYNVSRGYRLIPGDKCFKGGLDLFPCTVPCGQVSGTALCGPTTSTTGNNEQGSSANQGGSGGVVAAILVPLILIILIAVGLFVVKKTGKPEFLHEKLDSVLGKLSFSGKRRGGGGSKYFQVVTNADMEDSEETSAI